MDTKTVKTYDHVPGTPLAHQRVNLITNPYRTETATLPDGTAMEILYYYTDVKSSDYAITDDELTPLVFRDDKLIGWGWRALDDVKAKYELRIR